MDIIVCLKQVVDLQQIRIKKETKEPILEGLPLIFGDMDKNALEEAVRIKEKHEAKVTALSLGSAKLNDTIIEALAMGADEAVILTDPLFDVELIIDMSCGSPELGDPLGTAYTDESGYYEFDCLAPLYNPDGALDREWCEYCVTPVDATVPEGWITAYDASLILRYINSVHNLDKCPFSAVLKV